jgi:hypothetical protein
MLHKSYNFANRFVPAISIWILLVMVIECSAQTALPVNDQTVNDQTVNDQKTNDASRAADQPKLKVIKQVRDELGATVFTVSCPWQKSDTEIHVLVPKKLNPAEKLQVLFVLPVEHGSGHYWGKALEQIVKHDLHNKHRLLCVYPTFAALPWFADHPKDQASQQETYLLKGVLPFVDENYPTTAKPSDRLLVGFSKSGWGAFTLLLRNSKVFGKAAGWDAPLMMKASGNYGSGPIFGTQENFAANYHLTKLVKQKAEQFRGLPRLIHLGYGNFQTHHVQFEALLNELDVSHVYRHGPKRKHAWNSGWLPEAIQLLTNKP